MTAASALVAAAASRDSAIFASQTAEDGLTANHMYTVTNFNAKTGMVTLHNPWGVGAGAAVDTTLSLTTIPQGDTFFVANGTPAKF